MHSYTSSSDVGIATTGVRLLLGALLAMMCLLEAGSRYLVPKVSSEISRQTADYQAALRVGVIGGDLRPSVLMVGNSLLLLGVDRPALMQATEKMANVVTFPVENTAYWDWYFGLKRLFENGSRPAYVIVSLNMSQLLSDSVNGDRFAHQLMSMRDLPQARRKLSLDLTQTSDFAIANVSAWFGFKSGVRNWILERSVPNVSELVAMLAAPAKANPSLAEARTGTAIERLNELRYLCESNGSQFIWLLPASVEANDDQAETIQVAKGNGVNVLAPFRPGEMPAEYFSDGFHLNARGASAYTERLTAEIVSVVTAAR